MKSAVDLWREWIRSALTPAEQDALVRELESERRAACPSCLGTSDLRSEVFDTASDGIRLCDNPWHEGVGA